MCRGFFVTPSDSVAIIAANAQERHLIKIIFNSFSLKKHLNKIPKTYIYKNSFLDPKNTKA